MSVTPRHVPAVQKTCPFASILFPLLPNSTGIQKTQEIKVRSTLQKALPEDLHSAAPGTSLCNQVADAEDN